MPEHRNDASENSIKTESSSASGDHLINSATSADNASFNSMRAVAHLSSAPESTGFPSGEQLLGHASNMTPHGSGAESSVQFSGDNGRPMGSRGSSTDQSPSNAIDTNTVQANTTDAAAARQPANSLEEPSAGRAKRGGYNFEFTLFRLKNPDQVQRLPEKPDKTVFEFNLLKISRPRN